MVRSKRGKNAASRSIGANLRKALKVMGSSMGRDLGVDKAVSNSKRQYRQQLPICIALVDNDQPHETPTPTRENVNAFVRKLAPHSPHWLSEDLFQGHGHEVQVQLSETEAEHIRMLQQILYTYSDANVSHAHASMFLGWGYQESEPTSDLQVFKHKIDKMMLRDAMYRIMQFFETSGPSVPCQYQLATDGTRFVLNIRTSADAQELANWLQACPLMANAGLIFNRDESGVTVSIVQLVEKNLLESSESQPLIAVLDWDLKSRMISQATKLEKVG